LNKSLLFDGPLIGTKCCQTASIAALWWGSITEFEQNTIFHDPLLTQYVAMNTIQSKQGQVFS